MWIGLTFVEQNVTDGDNLSTRKWLTATWRNMTGDGSAGVIAFLCLSAIIWTCPFYLMMLPFHILSKLGRSFVCPHHTLVSHRLAQRLNGACGHEQAVLLSHAYHGCLLPDVYSSPWETSPCHEIQCSGRTLLNNWWAGRQYLLLGFRLWS